MIKIKGLSLQVGKKKEIDLTLKEAKQLYKELGLLFEVEVVKEYVPYQTYPYNRYPYVWYNSNTTAVNPTITYTGSTTNQVNYVSNNESMEIDLSKF